VEIHLIDIVEVSKRSGVPASTLRYYEEKRLIQSHGRRGLRRLFKPEVLQRLALITLAQNASFSLDEIAAMFTAEGPQIDRTLLLKKADELQQKIAQLQSMCDGLRHVAACRAPSHFECPKFLQLVNIVSQQQRKARPKKRVTPGGVLD
jgi:DNA-binding transcriptional MerR regulator